MNKRDFLKYGIVGLGGILLGTSLSPIRSAVHNTIDKGSYLLQVLRTEEEKEKPVNRQRNSTFFDFEKGYYGMTTNSLVEAPKKPNVILVVIDTLRADHLGCYGGNPFALFDKKPQGDKQYMQGASPAIDVFAGESAKFNRAYSTAPITDPSIASIFTSMPVTVHGIFNNAPPHLSLNIKTLAEILHSNGYNTMAFYSSAALDDRQKKGEFNSGLSRGFDVYRRQTRVSGIEGEDKLESPTAGMSMHSFLKWINENKKSKQPFFGWLHVYDPHRPYTPPQPFNSIFTPLSKYTNTPLLEDSLDLRDVMVNVNRTGDAPFLDETNLKAMESLYYGEIAYTSAVMSILFNKLNEWNLSDNTLVILTADHGDSMTGHGFLFEHVYSLYQDLTNIPLIVRCPWIVDTKKGMTLDSLASNMDIMPTILDIAGIDIPKGIFGESLVPLLKGEKTKIHDYVFSEMNYENIGIARAVVSDEGFCGIYTTSGWKRASRTEPTLHTGEELYDLNSDSGETVNLADRLPKKKAELKRAVDDFENEAASARRILMSGQGAQKKTTPTEEQKKALRALGYL